MNYERRRNLFWLIALISWLVIGALVVWTSR